MSYILDALKRADADRERGHVPGLHSQGDQHMSTGSSAPWYRQGMGVMALLILLAAAAVTWWGLRAPAGPKATDVRAAAAPAEPGTVDTAPSINTPGIPILLPEPAAQADIPAPVQRPSLPTRRQPVQSTAEPPEAVVEPDTADMADTASASDDAANPVATAPPPRPNTLPQRPSAPRQVDAADGSGRPPVKVSGSSYSQNPAHRMLIANGKVVHEGQEIEPGLKLETVGPRSAVLNHRGTLYNITY